MEEDDDDINGNTFGDVAVLEEDEDEYEVKDFTTTNNNRLLDDSAAVEEDLDNQWSEYALFAGDYDANELEDADEDAAQTIFPFLDHWHVLTEEVVDEDDGEITTYYSLAGIVSNHPRYPSGNAIVTASLDLALLEDNYDGEDDDENMEEMDVASRYCTPDSIVTTLSGSQYLLGPNPLVIQLDDWVVTDEGEIQGVITAFPQATTTFDEAMRAEPVVALMEQLNVQGRDITTSRIITTSAPLKESNTVTTTSGSHYRLGAPRVFPILNQWKRLEGGSIAGIVSRHKDIPDGELITTSPLVELDESSDGLVLVTTESGSQYNLGVAEPTKEELWQQKQQQLEAAAIVQDEEEWMDAPHTIHTPHPPSTNPLLPAVLEEAIFSHYNDEASIVGSQVGAIGRGGNQTVWNAA